MSDEEGHPPDLFLRHPRVSQEFSDHWRAFRLLKAAGGAAVFLTAQRTRDIVCYGRRLKKELGLRIQSFQFPDGFRIGLHPQEMIDVMTVPV